MGLYDDHATKLVKDVIPKEDLKILINVFMKDASINMGNDFSDETLERTIEIVESSFKFLPVCYVAAAFKKGSLGKYGAGRLVPRIINGWLNEITMEYNTDQDRKKFEEINNTIYFKNLERYPLGKAICWKIDHVSEEYWDRVSLKEVAEIIGRGGIPSLETFEIKSE